MSGLKKNADVVQELISKPGKRDDIDLNKLITAIETTMEPFLINFQDEKLYCISQVSLDLRILQEAFSNSDTATTMV